MTKRRILWGLLIVVASGCAKHETPHNRTASEGVPRTSPHEVAVLDEAGLANLVHERKGKALFLNLWATWCAPCVEEFPAIVRLSKESDTGKVEFVAISADFPDEIAGKVQPFVDKHQVPFRVYVAGFKHQEDFINAVDSSWSGALPATLIFDASGRRRFFRVGEGAFGVFRSALDSVIGR